MDNFAITSTAALLRKIPDQNVPATDKLRLAWQLLADAFRHPKLKEPQFEELRRFVTPIYHVRNSEPLSFLGFAAAAAGDDGSYGDAINSTGFRDEICNRAILAVADWADEVADRIEEHRTAGHLGLTVDAALGEVRRQGRSGIARFELGSAEWHMFECAWQAGAIGATGVAMQTGYPGDATPVARKSVKQNANKLLAGLGVRLAPNRPPMLEPIPE